MPRHPRRVCRQTVANRTLVNQGGTIMYARVTIGQFLPAKADDGIRIYRDSVVPAAKQQKGFKGFYVLTDRKTGKGSRLASGTRKPT